MADWVMVRVQKDTHTMLEKVRQGMLTAAEQGNYAVDLDARGRVSLDQVIRELAYDKLKHRVRAREAKRRAAELRRAGLLRLAEEDEADA